jgi:acyl-coenzyme A thioesterase PaaI-like protein
MLSNLTIANMRLFAFSFWKLPMVFFCRPRIIQIDDTTTIVKIKLNRRTKNHLNSFYFGAFAVGADITAGYMAFEKILKTKKNIPLVFKDFHAEFYQKALGDVFFKCEDGKIIDDMISQTIQTGERVHQPLTIWATVPKISNEPVAKFTLTLSIKHKPKREK